MSDKVVILIIDDDTDIATVIRYCFANQPNIELFYASSGEDGLKIALEKEPHVILLDVIMPRMSGIETYKALRLIPKLNQTCIIFLTAKSQKSEIQQYLDLGAFAVIPKPFDPLTLSNQVLALYDEYKEQKT